MADTGAPFNLPFPVDTDLVIDGAQAIEDLAEAVATELGSIDAGQITSGRISESRLPVGYKIYTGIVAPSSVGAATSLSVVDSFPAGFFSSAPAVATSITVTDPLLLVSASATTTSVVFSRRNNDSVARTFGGAYICIGPGA